MGRDYISKINLSKSICRLFNKYQNCLFIMEHFRTYTADTPYKTKMHTTIPLCSSGLQKMEQSIERLKMIEPEVDRYAGKKSIRRNMQEKL